MSDTLDPTNHPHAESISALIRYYFCILKYVKKKDNTLELADENATSVGDEYVYRGVCKICKRSGTNYECVTGEKVGNATTAANHLKKKHMCDLGSQIPVEFLAQFASAEAIANMNLKKEENEEMDRVKWMKSVVKRGISYSQFDDADYTKGLVWKFNSHSARNFVKDCALYSLKLMGATIKRAGESVSFVADLGTMHGIHALNIVVVHIALNQSWLLSSVQVENSEAETLYNHLQDAICKFRDFCNECQVSIASIVTDGAPNLIAAVKMLEVSGKFCRGVIGLNCGCHVLNLIAKDVDKLLLQELGLTEAEKTLLTAGAINRVCVTRWWSKLREFERAVTGNLNVTVSLPKGSVLVEGIQLYIARTHRLRDLSRVLERNDSNAVVSCNVLGELMMDSQDPIIVNATVNRYIKWYADSDVPLLISFFSHTTCETLSTLLEITEFKNALYLAVMPALSRHCDEGVVVGDVFCKWVDGVFKLMCSQGSPDFCYNQIETGTPGVAIRRLCTSLACIVASESAAERSFSLNRLIRDGRYSLDHKNAENELIFASNAIEEADVPTERTLRYFNSINEVEHFPLPSVQSQPSKTQEDPQEIKRQGLSKYHEVIPARYGHSIIVLWYYTTQFWNPMLQMKIPTTESKRESKIDVMFFHLNSWHPGVLAHHNATKGLVWVKVQDKTLYRFTAAAAFSVLLQPLRYNEHYKRERDSSKVHLPLFSYSNSMLLPKITETFELCTDFSLSTADVSEEIEKGFDTTRAGEPEEA